MNNAKTTREYFESKINADQRWLERAILAIYERQTNDEQATEDSKYHNLRGFNGPDAKRMSYYAKWILGGKHLSRHHVDIARKRMKKYTGQLVVIAEEKVQV